MTEIISKIMIIIYLILLIIIFTILSNLYNKIDDMEKRNLQVHEYILDRIEIK